MSGETFFNLLGHMGMERFEWSQNLSIGDELIDGQHRVWIEKLNDLSNAIDSRRGGDEIFNLLKFMVDYVESHFLAEEQYMAGQNYPGLERHKLEHSAFCRMLSDLLALDRTRPGAIETIASSINNFQIVWLKHHITRTDGLFGEFLRKKGGSFPGLPS